MLNKLENEVSGGQNRDQEDYRKNPFSNFLKKSYVCASQIIISKFFTFTLTEKINLSISTEGVESKSLYSVLMDPSFKVLKPLNVINKKDELNNTLLADIHSDRAILVYGFSQNDGNAVFKLTFEAVWYP